MGVPSSEKGGGGWAHQQQVSVNAAALRGEAAGWPPWQQTGGGPVPPPPVHHNALPHGGQHRAYIQQSASARARPRRPRRLAALLRPTALDGTILANVAAAAGAAMADPLMSLVDSAAAGRLGTPSLAALGACGAAFSVLYFLAFTPLALLAAQAVAASLARRDAEACGRGLAQALAAAAAASAGMAATLLLAPQLLLRLFVVGGDGEVLGLAVTYATTRALSLPAALSLAVLQAAFRARLDLTTPLCVVAAVNVANAGLNELLMFHAGWGMKGCGWASVASQYLGAGLFAAALWRRRFEFGLPQALAGAADRAAAAAGAAAGASDEEEQSPPQQQEPQQPQQQQQQLWKGGWTWWRGRRSVGSSSAAAGDAAGWKHHAAVSVPAAQLLAAAAAAAPPDSTSASLRIDVAALQQQQQQRQGPAPRPGDAFKRESITPRSPVRRRSSGGGSSIMLVADDTPRRRRSSSDGLAAGSAALLRRKHSATASPAAAAGPHMRAVGSPAPSGVVSLQASGQQGSAGSGTHTSSPAPFGGGSSQQAQQHQHHHHHHHQAAGMPPSWSPPRPRPGSAAPALQLPAGTPPRHSHQLGQPDLGSALHATSPQQRPLPPLVLLSVLPRRAASTALLLWDLPWASFGRRLGALSLRGAVIMAMYGAASAAAGASGTAALAAHQVVGQAQQAQMAWAWGFLHVGQALIAGASGVSSGQQRAGGGGGAGAHRGAGAAAAGASGAGGAEALAVRIVAWSALSCSGLAAATYAARRLLAGLFSADPVVVALAGSAGLPAALMLALAWNSAVEGVLLGLGAAPFVVRSYPCAAAAGLVVLWVGRSKSAGLPGVWWGLATYYAMLLLVLGGRLSVHLSTALRGRSSGLLRRQLARMGAAGDD